MIKPRIIDTMPNILLQCPGKSYMNTLSHETMVAISQNMSNMWDGCIPKRNSTFNLQPSTFNLPPNSKGSAFKLVSLNENEAVVHFTVADGENRAVTIPKGGMPEL